METSRAQDTERPAAAPQQVQPAVDASSNVAGVMRQATATAPAGNVSSAAEVESENDIDTIRKEGLTGRQLRMARRVAQKHGLAPTSDFDAVRQLRARNIDPFQRANILELVVPAEGTGMPDDGTLDDGSGGGIMGQIAPIKKPDPRVQLPQTIPAGGNTLPSTEMAPADRRSNEIQRIQRDIAKRRRLKVMMLLTRLSFFVFLPTIIAGWYFYAIATPMYATYSEFFIQKNESQGAGAGLGGLFQGTGLATQTDAIGVQSYLSSRDALTRLDGELNYKDHFSDPDIDVIQRLSEGATLEEAYALYQDHVKIGYDPTEGLLKMEVIAASPEMAEAFAVALIGYAEEEVDSLTDRIREDQMTDARASYEEAEERRLAALNALLGLQEDTDIIDAAGEIGAKIQQITTFETEMLQKQLELASLLSVRQPNEARVVPLRGEISRLQNLIDGLRADVTEASSSGGNSVLSNNTELRLAEENYSFQAILVQQALQAMEAARIEANRQASYVTLNVQPIAPESAAYPKAFENTFLAFLIFAGIYLMCSLTASILREQVSS